VIINIIFWIFCILYILKLLINIGHLIEVALKHIKGQFDTESDALLLAPEVILLPLASVFFAIKQASALLGFAFFLAGILALTLSIGLGALFGWMIKKYHG